MPNTASMIEVALGVRKLLHDNLNNLKLRQIWYGDQDKVPETPGAAVDLEGVSRELAGVPDMTKNTFRISIYVYHNKVAEKQENRLECDQRAEAIETLIHKDLQLGGLVYYIHVADIESGFARRANGLFVSTRLGILAYSKRSLSMLA